MVFRRSGKFSKLIILALVIYASVSLVALRARIEEARAELSDVRRQVAEQELSNAELEFETENYDDPDVIAGIARSNLGLVLPGEIIFYDVGSNTSD